MIHTHDHDELKKSDTLDGNISLDSWSRHKVKPVRWSDMKSLDNSIAYKLLVLFGIKCSPSMHGFYGRCNMKGHRDER